MLGSTVFSLLIAGLIIQTPSWARICSAQISPSSAGRGAKDTLPQQVPSGVDNDPVRSPDDQTSLQRSDDGKFTLRRDVEEVILNATVVDSHRRRIESLHKENFRVTEDGVVQTIADFEHQDMPISLAILVDNSGSMGTKRQAVNTSAIDLVNASNREDETVIVNFADEAYQDTDLTSSISELQQGLSHIGSRGGTALYDAVVVSADYLKTAAKHSKQVILSSPTARTTLPETHLKRRCDVSRTFKVRSSTRSVCCLTTPAAGAKFTRPSMLCNGFQMRQAELPTFQRSLRR